PLSDRLLASRRALGAADVADAERPDRALPDQRRLRRFARGAEPAVEVGAPLEVQLLVPGVQLGSEGLVRMEVGVVRAPLVQGGRAVRVVSCGDEAAVLALVPLGRR